MASTHAAASAGSLQMVQDVLRHDVGALAVPNKACDLPLHVAMKHRAPPEVVLVLAQGHTAALKTQNGIGIMPLELQCPSCTIDAK